MCPNQEQDQKTKTKRKKTQKTKRKHFVSYIRSEPHSEPGL